MLKSGIKNCTKAILNLSSNVIGDSNNYINFPHKLLLSPIQILGLRKVFTNILSANIKLSKTQLYKMLQSGGAYLFKSIIIFPKILF